MSVCSCVIRVLDILLLLKIIDVNDLSHSCAHDQFVIIEPAMVTVLSVLLHLLELWHLLERAFLHLPDSPMVIS